MGESTDGLLRRPPRAKTAGYRPAKHQGITGWDQPPDGTNVLANIIAKQGWSGPMTVLDDKAFDRAAADAPAVVYRGVTAHAGQTPTELNQEFLEQDDPHIGRGVNGYGWYTTDHLGTANVYAGAPPRARRDSDRSKIGGPVVEMAFRPEARILEVTETKDRRDDLGQYAAQLGYDAVKVPGTTPGESYYLLLNRSAVVARRMRQ